MGDLFYGDNLDILRRYIADESVDLVYLDPPFNSAQTYNAFFQEKDGTAAAAQIQAFEDTWEWNSESQRAYEELSLRSDKLGSVMRAFMEFLGPNDMMAYLAMMAPRLVELRRALKPSGSLYLHCDPTASHYLKLLLDAVFGKEHYENEIVWKRTSAHSSAKRYGPNRDTILYYSKGETKTWNSLRLGYSEEYLEAKYGNEDEKGRYSLGDLTAAGTRNGESGKTWRGIDPNAKGVHWKFGVTRLDELDKEGRIHWPKGGGLPRYKRYLDEVRGIVLQEIWDDIPPINSMAKERLGYPTQKPVALLERIIAASSNPGDVVLDPFCGCGTTIDAAQKLGREWIGIDITHLAITLIKNRLADTYGAGFIAGQAPRLPAGTMVVGEAPPEAGGASTLQIRIIGEPEDLSGARELAAQDKYQFQWWALGLVGARPVEQKKGTDGGVDGKVFFRDHPDPKQKPQVIIFSVKGGGLKLDDVRALDSVVKAQHAAIGVLLSMDEPTAKMKEWAATCGFFTSEFNGQKFPRIQLRTIGQLLAGVAIERPSGNVSVDETFKKAPKAKAKGHEQTNFGM